MSVCYVQELGWWSSGSSLFGCFLMFVWLIKFCSSYSLNCVFFYVCVGINHVGCCEWESIGTMGSPRAPSKYTRQGNKHHHHHHHHQHYFLCIEYSRIDRKLESRWCALFVWRTSHMCTNAIQVNSMNTLADATGRIDDRPPMWRRRLCGDGEGAIALVVCVCVKHKTLWITIYIYDSLYLDGLDLELKTEKFTFSIW